MGLSLLTEQLVVVDSFFLAIFDFNLQPSKHFRHLQNTLSGLVVSPTALRINKRSQVRLEVLAPLRNLNSVLRELCSKLTHLSSLAYLVLFYTSEGLLVRLKVKVLSRCLQLRDNPCFELFQLLNQVGFVLLDQLLGRVYFPVQCLNQLQVVLE